MLVRAGLQGLWTRSLIEWPGGERDQTTSVFWLQGPTRYIDLRQPAEAPDFTRATALRTLAMPEILWLAEQEGFAGTFVQHSDCFEWERRIDFQPKPLYSDRGTLEDVGGMMVEVGCEIPYVEHWHRDSEARTPAAAIDLVDDETGQRGAVVRVGPRFMYARARAGTLDETRHLRDYVAAATTLEEAQDLVDCELSFGTVTPGGWRIERSTLPFRVAAVLQPRPERDKLIVCDCDPDGTAFARRWSIVAEEGGFSAI